MGISWGIQLLIGLLYVSMVTAVLPTQDMRHRCYARQRDLNIAFLTGMSSIEETDSHLKCGRENWAQQVPVISLAYTYAIDQVNANPHLLPNISLGFVLLDTCNQDLSALADILHMLPNTEGSDFFPEEELILCEDVNWKQFKAVGAVGPDTSAAGVMTGGLSTLFHFPLIFTYASSDELSDKSRFAYTMRLVPPDRLQAEAMINLVVHFGWSYVSLLYFQGPYGENGAKQLEKQAKEKGICIAFKYMFPSDSSAADGKEVARKLALYTDARVVLVFIKDSHLRLLLPFLEKQGLIGHFIWVGSDYLKVNSDENPKMAALRDNAFSVFPVEKLDDEFVQYFKMVTPKSHPDDPFLKSAYSQKYNCKWNHTLGDASCYKYESEPHNITDTLCFECKVIDGVKVFAYALHALITDTCPDAFNDKFLLDACINGQKLHEYLLNVEFNGHIGHIKFDEKGDFLGSYTIFQYSQGIWVPEVARWNTRSSSLAVNLDKLHWSGIEGSKASKFWQFVLCVNHTLTE